jgi:hypothetical protein
MRFTMCGSRLLREMEQAYGWPKVRRNQSYAALRAVNVSLRGCLPHPYRVSASMHRDHPGG